MNKKCIMIACAFFVAVALQAKVSLPAFFSDGMVMQQQSQASLWGKASKGKIVEVGRPILRELMSKESGNLLYRHLLQEAPMILLLMMVNALGLRISLWVNYGFVRGRAIWRCL